MDIKDLRASLDFGNTYADAARMLCRDEDEVRQKAKELGLVEQRKKWWRGILLKKSPGGKRGEEQRVETYQA
jgi:hypothetical protein